jgi:holo-[acyl-carrier protein] synthase
MRVGVDLIEIERIRRALDRYPGFRERCFTDAERAYCESRKNPAQSYAGRFAGKEAVGKALGLGVARAFAWREIEIVGRPKPSVTLYGRAAAWAERVQAGRVDLSMTHSRELAAAVAVVADAE